MQWDDMKDILDDFLSLGKLEEGLLMRAYKQ
jgi:hypothetical protein